MFLKQLKKNKNKGFTLVELIVTVALFSIMGIGAMVLLIQTSNIFQSTSKLNNIQNATLILTDTIKAQMYCAEEVEIQDVLAMPSVAERGDVTAMDQPEKYGYLYFNPNTGILEKAIGTQEALGISMDGVTGLAKDRFQFEVLFSNSAEDDVILIEVYVYDQFSDDPYDPIYVYDTSFYLHNLQYAADIAAQATAEDVPEADEEEEEAPAPDNGHIGGDDYGFGLLGNCIKYRIAD